MVDSANHTLRRIDLIEGRVETIAGTPGIPGLADGTGQEARFNLPAGIALETELLVEQLERERRGEPPPPITVVVADAGNGVLRRVTANGDVTTLGVTSEAAGTTGRSSSAQAVQRAVTFDFPTALGIDSFGNIYVTEPGRGQVTAILRDGKTVPAAQVDTFVSPNGIVVAESGRLIITDSDRTGRELAYGAPAIGSVTPEAVSAEGGTVITIKGENFAPDSLVVIAGKVIPDPQIDDTQTITLVTPVLPSGRNTLTVQNRGGLDQSELRITSIPFSELAQGSITTVAGGTTFSGDGGPATEAVLSLPRAMALDRAGNLFIADPENHRVRKVEAASGIITTVAGTGEADFSGDGGSATAAALFRPSGVAVDAAGNLFIADTSNFRIRKVEAALGIITTVAGNGKRGFSGDEGLASEAALNNPLGVIVDAAGNLLIADSLNTRVRKVDALTGIITTVAGGGSSRGPGVPATEAALTDFRDLAVDSAGNLFIPDLGDDRVAKVDVVTGIITFVAGAGDNAPNIDGIPATEASLFRPRDVAVDAADNLFILEGEFGHRVRKVDAMTGIITTVAGTDHPGFSGDGGSAIEAELNKPERIAVDGVGNLFIADSLNDRIRKVDAISGIITTVAGSDQEDFLGDGSPATEAVLRFPQQIAFDGGGNFLIADTVNDRIRKVDLSTGIITTVAGTGEHGFTGDGELATEANLRSPKGVAVNGAGDVFIGDTFSHRIRKVDIETGIITTLAGNGERGFSGDDGPAAEASLNQPRHVAVDADGNLLIIDAANHRVRRVDLTSGIITTVAGNGERGFSGDEGLATESSLNNPRSVTVDAAGHLFIADASNHRIRRVDLTSGIITTVAGNDEQGFSGDEGLASEATLDFPVGVAFDKDGNLFIADLRNNRIRKVDALTGIITTVAGSGATGRLQGSFSGDGGPATEATLNGSGGVALDGEGNLYIVDFLNSRIRAIRGPIP
ncbi:IPT/TIG domain-containing protein [Acidobacteria bacterium AH-259-D05]|nr:IPT/TIG domain-containing protein [Acidobacteria bacterium AH-259-D05]